MKNKPICFCYLRGSQGVGGGRFTMWEKFPNNPVIFFSRASLIYQVVCVKPQPVLWRRKRQGLPQELQAVNVAHVIRECVTTCVFRSTRTSSSVRSFVRPPVRPSCAKKSKSHLKPHKSSQDQARPLI